MKTETKIRAVAYDVELIDLRTREHLMDRVVLEQSWPWIWASCTPERKPPQIRKRLPIWREMPMINAQNVSFPLTIEAFSALQRAEIGREPTKSEQEFFGVIVEMANSAYMAGCIGNHDTIVDMVRIINDSFGEDPAGKHLAALCRGWLFLGFRRGLELLESTCNPQS